VYFDSCYIIKFYLDDPDSDRVRSLVESARVIRASCLAFTELHGALHRRMREQSLPPRAARLLSDRFTEHLEGGLWELIPVNDSLLRRTGSAILSIPSGLFLRSADAVHLVTAREAGEHEIWTSDRHMLAAASHFGLVGRSV
jgi:predicted nucleic acid-binding protein